MPARLGDDVDDYCIKCRRLTNHLVVSLLADEPAKVRCRTCHSDHDYRREQVPPPKVDARKTASKAAAAVAEAAPAEAVPADASAEGGAAAGADVEPSEQISVPAGATMPKIRRAKRAEAQ